jgi:hypothetical protein
LDTPGERGEVYPAQYRQRHGIFSTDADLPSTATIDFNSRLTVSRLTVVVAQLPLQRLFEGARDRSGLLPKINA